MANNGARAASSTPRHDAPARASLVVWAFTDRKPGHENQTRGLVRALTALVPADCHWLAPRSTLGTLAEAITGRFSPGAALPDPQILIGAGHATHLPMLMARRARGGRAVVLMAPSLPLAWFDLCVIPEHDAVQGTNVLVTRGALNTITPGSDRDPNAGLILIGGPSRHHGWSGSAIVAQVEALVRREPARRWTLTTSRRTPPETLAALRTLELPNLTIVAYADTDSGWVPARLAHAACAWVSEDSVSMTYEALTAGAATGLLAVPRRRPSRLVRGVDRLVADGLVTRFADWQRGAPLAPVAAPLDEAARVATWIRDTWLVH